MDFTLLFNLLYNLFSVLTLSLPPRQMVSLNRNPEDRANKDDLNVPAQTQRLQVMAPIMVDTRQHVTKQASSPGNNNSLSSDNHQITTFRPSFDKGKLLAIQAQVLQGRMQSNTVSPHSMELAKVEVPTGLVKRQVAEAWNRQGNKRSRGTPELERERQHKDIKTPGICQCCVHYGRPCLQEEDSLITAEARQRYHSDINRKLSMQDLDLEGVAQNPTINLEDWTITFKEFQPKRSKQSKKPVSKASQEKMEFPQQLADSSTRFSFNQPQPKVVQSPHDNSIKKNHDVQRVMVEQKK